MASEAFSEYGSHAHIFDFILGKKSGLLTFQPGGRKLYFEEGNLVFASSETSGEHFSDILVTMGVLDADTLAEVRAQMPQGESMGRKLKELGLATPAQLAESLKQQITNVVDRVFTQESGDVDVGEGPLTGRVPKLKIQILALIMRTISGMASNGFLDQVPTTTPMVAGSQFAEKLAIAPLPANYQPFSDLVGEGNPLTADEISDQLGWENRLVYGLAYILNAIGATEYSESEQEPEQGELFAPVPVDLPGDDEDDALDATVIDQENPLDLSIQDGEGLDGDETLVDLNEDEEDALESSLDIDADELGMDDEDEELSMDDKDVEPSLGLNAEDGDALGSSLDLDADGEDALESSLDLDADGEDALESSLDLDADGEDALESSLDLVAGDEDDGLEASLESLEASLPDADDELDDDFSESLDDNFDEQFQDDGLDDDGPIAGPPTDLLASALDDTLDDEESPDNDSAVLEAPVDPELAFDDPDTQEDPVPSHEGEMAFEDPDTLDAQGDDDTFDSMEMEADADEELGLDALDAAAELDASEELGLDALDAAAEPDSSEELGLDAMDRAAAELEEEGYGLDGDDDELAFSEEPGTEETLAVGTFSMEDEPAASFGEPEAPYSGEFSAADLGGEPSDAFDINENDRDTASFDSPSSEEGADTASFDADFDDKPEPFSYDEPTIDERDEQSGSSEAIMPEPGENNDGLYETSSKSRRPVFLAIVAIIALAAVGGYWYMNRPVDLTPPPAQDQAQAQPDATTPEPVGDADPAEDAASGEDTPPPDTLQPENTDSAASVADTHTTDTEPAESEPAEVASSTPPTTSQPKPEPAKTVTPKPATESRPPAATSQPAVAGDVAPFTGNVATFSDETVTRFKAKGQPYSVALMLACEEATVRRFLSSNAHENIYVFPRDYEGRKCFTIAYGSFDKYGQAAGGRDAIPEYLKRYEGAWVKNFKDFL